MDAALVGQILMVVVVFVLATANAQAKEQQFKDLVLERIKTMRSKGMAADEIMDHIERTHYRPQWMGRDRETVLMTVARAILAGA